MFKCPNCGFEDSPIWKSAKWLRYSVYCNATELESLNPDLFKKLEKESWIKENGYYYKLTRNHKIVYRMLDMGKSEFSSHGFTEKPKSREKNFQLERFF